MKKTTFGTTSLLGANASKEFVITHTTFETDRKIQKLYPTISGEEISNFLHYSLLCWKPSTAISTIEDELSFNMIGLRKNGKPFGVVGVFDNLNEKVLSKPIRAFLFEKEKGVYEYYSTNPNSKALYWMLMGMEVFSGNKTLAKLFKTLDFSKRLEQYSADTFIEENQFPVFGQLSSGLLYMAKTKLLASNKVYTIDPKDADDSEYISTYLQQADQAVNISNWFHSNESETELTDVTKVLIANVTEGDDSRLVTEDYPASTARRKKPSSKQKRLAEFLKKDWSLLSEKEAKELPLFLQTTRKQCRELFEANKDFMSYENALLVEQIYNGDLSKLSFFGPAGTGKTMTAQMIAGALHLPFQLVVGKAGVDSSVYLGYESIVSNNGTSVTKWHDGNITQAVRYGALLLFDEVNFTNPEVLGSMNTLLDGSQCLVMDSGEVVPAHKNFVYIEAMNIGVGYDGTSEMNNSWTNRIAEHVQFKPFSVEEEVEILSRNTGYERKDVLKKLVQIEHSIRKQIPVLGDASTQVISIRNVQNWIRKAKYTDEWVESAIPTVLAPLFKTSEEFESFDFTSLTDESFLSTVMSEIKDSLEYETYEE